MCIYNKPCKNGVTCDNSKCTVKVDLDKLAKSKANKESIVSNNLIVKK